MPSTLLSIGELARRTGLSVSAIRFYEARGLVKAVLTKFPGAQIVAVREKEPVTGALPSGWTALSAFGASMVAGSRS